MKAEPMNHRAQLIVCGHTFTYFADKSGSVRLDWTKRTERSHDHETGEVIERPLKNAEQA